MKRIVYAIMLSLLLVGCGGVSQRQKTLTLSLAAVDAASAGFVEWDEEHQQQIVDSATSYEEGQAALARYRDEREKAETLFALAYQGLAAAALERGDITVESAIERVRQLQATLFELMR